MYDTYNDRSFRRSGRRFGFRLRSILGVLALLLIAYFVLRMDLLSTFGIDTSPLTRLIPGLGNNENTGLLNRVLRIAGIATGVNVQVSADPASGNQVATIAYDVSRFANMGQILAQGAPEAQLEELLSSGQFSELNVENVSVRYDQASEDLIVSIVAPEQAISKITEGDLPLQEIFETVLGSLDIGDLVQGVTE